MKFFKIFVAAVLLSVCSLAGGEDVQVINLAAGDQVNASNFTVVAKASGFQKGDSITIQVRLTNNTTGQMSTEQLSVTAK